MITKICGTSVDLIEIEGDINEEFSVTGYRRALYLGVSDGTLLRIEYSSEGLWRIRLLKRGASFVRIDQTSLDDDGGYSDVAVFQTIENDLFPPEHWRLQWIVCGDNYV